MPKPDRGRSSAVSAIALLSGGLDSTVATTVVVRDDKVDEALTVDYGQAAAGAELRAGRDIARSLGVPHRAIKLDLFSSLYGGALLDPTEPLPEPSPDELDGEPAAQSAKAVWVPNRNGVLINLAAAVAEARGVSEVVVGFNREEAATFPDNGRAFLERITASLALSTANAVRVSSPTLDWNKTEIVAEGYRIGAPMNLIWACYRGEARPCWRCESCKRFERALRASGSWERYRGEVDRE